MVTERSPLRVAFAGSHEISWHCLRVIADLCEQYGDDLLAVFNHPSDTGARHSAFVEFDTLESAYGFAHYKVNSLSAPETLQLLRGLELDVLFIIGWHRIVPQQVIDCSDYCLGMHASLLPKDRGSSPINWSIIRRQSEGGLSYFHLTAGVDSGDIIAQRAWRIGERATCRELYDKAISTAAVLLRENWDDLRAHTLRRVPQDESQATVNARRRPADGLIDWNHPAPDVDALVRALTHPYPGAFSYLRGKKLFVWQADVAPGADAPPGTILSTGEAIRIASGQACVKAERVQFEGEPECSAAVFSTVYSLQPGEVLSTEGSQATE